MTNPFLHLLPSSLDRPTATTTFLLLLLLTLAAAAISIATAPGLRLRLPFPSRSPSRSLRPPFSLRSMSWSGPLGWLGMGRGSSSSRGHKGGSTLEPQAKFKGFYDLAKEALERGYQADAAGDGDRALQLYSTGLQAVQEALKVPVQGSGLGPKADNTAAWKVDLAEWEVHARERVKALRSRDPSAGPSPPSALNNPFVPYQSLRHPQPQRQPQPQAQPQRPPPQQQQQQQRPLSSASVGSRRATGSGGGAAPSPSTGAGGAGGQQRGGPAGGSGSGSGGRGDQQYRDTVLAEIMDRGPSVTWDDIAGLQTAKQALIEAVVLPTLRADIFSGLRAPVRGILLYGPPGNGKTMLGKVLAHEAKACFFAISASSLTSKWVGEGEKLVRALFQVAAEKAPSIIFIDEIDSILTSRTSGENDAMRRLKTEFLVQFDGVMGGDDRVVVIGATNRPQELDEAVLRRLVKRVFIPLPDTEGRSAIFRRLLRDQTSLSPADLSSLVRATPGYSASDLTALCKEAAMGPIRELGPAIAKVKSSSIRSIQLKDFAAALNVIKPSVSKEVLQSFDAFTRDYGAQ